MKIIEVKNDYLAHLIGFNVSKSKDISFFYLSDSTEAAAEEFGYDVEKMGTPLASIASYGESQNENKYGGFESSYLLGYWIGKALNDDFSHSYPYNKKAIKKLFNKPEYNKIESEVLIDIRRIYDETQSFLTNLYPDGIVPLFRQFNQIQEEQFKKGENVTFNYITSFSTKGKYHYTSQINRKMSISKKRIFAYTNLSYDNVTLGEQEDEVIVFGLPKMEKSYKR